ncbi:MAG TPA: DUF4339 domain-containing protein [Gemmataceae bacterium]|nr:DUF4339 domain-containing protein [Gemmataceae bacterium]
MAEMWYYTTEGKQMDPVSMKELKRLVGDGTLKPTDMVWKDGMARWIRASSVKELFPDPISALDHYFSSAQDPVKKDAGPTSVTAASATSSPTPASAKSVPATVDDEEEETPRKKRKRSSDDDDDRDNGKPPKRRAESSRGGGGGSSIGIIIGVVVLVLFLLVGCGGGFAILLIFGLKDAEPIKGQVSYQASIGPHGSDSRTFHFRRGVDYELTVRSDPRQPDVDLFVIKSSTGVVIIADQTIGPDSLIRWTPGEEGDYRVEVRNLHNFMRVTSNVQIREIQPNQAPPPPPPPKDKQIPPPKDGGPQPLPPDTREGKGSISLGIVQTNTERVQKFRVRAGHKVDLRVVPNGKGANIDFNLFVHRDSDNAMLASDDGPGAVASVSFVPQATEIVRVRIVNAGQGPKTNSSAKLFFDVSP